MQQVSEYRKVWLRFRRNRPAVVALGYILVAVLIAIFGYQFVPDNSPDANRQAPGLALAPPGTRAALLLLPLPGGRAEQSGFDAFFCGKQPENQQIPIDPASLSLNGDSIFYRSPGVSFRETHRLHLATVFYPAADSIQVDGTDYVVSGHDGASTRISKTALQEKWSRGEMLQFRVFPLGADQYGRCVFSRLMLGFRVSLLVGLIAVVISLTLGLFIGLLGGYFGGRLDDLAMLLINTVWSIPTLLLVFAIVLALGRGVGIIFLAVGLTMWVDVARVVRGQTMALRGLPFVEAARSMGMSHWRILLRHILPNLTGPVLVVAAGNFATAILVESGLGYLGFGVQPPSPSWGSMLNENYGYALSGKLFLALTPALVIALTVLAFNLVGNGLRDALDVRSAGKA